MKYRCLQMLNLPIARLRDLLRVRGWANVFAALALLWTSGQFTHAHEFAPHHTHANIASVHATGSGMQTHVHAANPHADASETEGLHCGVPLLGAQTQEPALMTGPLSHQPGANTVRWWQNVRTYDPPPPRT